MFQAEDIFAKINDRLHGNGFAKKRGRVHSATGRIIKAPLDGVKIGEMCVIRSPNHRDTFAEVIGFQRDLALLSPLGELSGMSSQTEIEPLGRELKVPVSDQLLGQVLNGLGEPMDPTADKSWLLNATRQSTEAEPPNPLIRRPIVSVLETGIKAIDSAITVGEGQRLGILACAGVGKSTLMAELTKGTKVDVVVCALVGERGREVNDFIENALGEEGMRRAVLVVATSDRPPLERIKAAHTAAAIAEYFRDQGQKVLFLMDSVTRYARALREIGIQVGEPPARRGFPPSVFAALPRLVERAGNCDKGSITAFYTILSEGEDDNDPIAEEMRSLLDGHISLSKKLANAGHYPAIDVLGSISRVMTQISDDSQVAAATKMRELMAKYKEIELLVNMGEYQKGSDPVADEAIAKRDRINQFLRQGISQHQDLEVTQAELSRIVEIYG